jgi:hypothetical protein
VADWVLVANPSATETLTAEVSFTNQADGQTLTSTRDIVPGEAWTPAFPGMMGGPVELKAWLAGGSWPVDGRDVIASQRVLSNFGTAFNEVPGTPASELSGNHMWTWYDMAGTGFTDWILVANPSDTEIVCDIYIGGVFQPEDESSPNKGYIPAHGVATPFFPGLMDGPVEVKAYTDATRTTPAPVIASQRVIAGPSFEEVPGTPVAGLAADYHWTWYDMQSPGSTNWVLIANPGGGDIYYDVMIAGAVQGQSAGNPGVIPAHGRVTPFFRSLMSGPVEVKAYSDQARTVPAPVIASQRVLWNGHFNEVTGAVLD